MGTVCVSCRLRLSHIVCHGFNQARPSLASISTKPLPVSQSILHENRHFGFTPSRRDPSSDYQTTLKDVPRSAEQLESVARQARRRFGDSLPNDLLTPEEYAVYERLYGPPIDTIPSENVEILQSSVEPEEEEKNTLLRENGMGELEEVEIEEEGKEDFGHEEVTARSSRRRELEVMKRLEQDISQARRAQPEEQVEEQVEEEIDDVEEDETDEMEDPDAYANADILRSHPLTIAGRCGTAPATLQLPKSTFTDPITNLLADPSNRHLLEVSHRTLGGPGLPFSPSTPSTLRHLPQNPVALEAGQSKMGEMESNVYLAAVMPATYAAVMNALIETRKRLGSIWLGQLLTKEGGPSVLDAGAGGAGVAAWREVLRAEWEAIQADRTDIAVTTPFGSSTVVTGSTTLRHRVSRFLGETTFLPRLPDYVHPSLSQGEPSLGLSGQGKQYDVIIAPYTLWSVGEDYQRKHHVEKLWSLLNPNGGVLILLEKGLPRGFEAIAGARQMLLDNHIASPESPDYPTELQSPSTQPRIRKEAGMVIAPCTNHAKCPMYLTPGMQKGRKDFCHFSQRYIRPAFLQQILGAKSRNHEDVQFSYLSVQRGRDARADGLVQGTAATDDAFRGHGSDESADSGRVHTLSLPRAILPPLKRRGHVVLDLCTPAGRLERWTVPRSFDRQAYRDARKSRWGDLWALGAKTRVERKIRLGNGQHRTRGKGKQVFEVDVGDSGMEGVRALGGGKVRREKRNKKGRRPPREMTEKDLM